MSKLISVEARQDFLVAIAVLATFAGAVMFERHIRAQTGTPATWPATIRRTPTFEQQAIICDAEVQRLAGLENANLERHAAALARFEASLRCAPSSEVEELAFAAACNAHNSERAKAHWAALSPPQQVVLAPICVRNCIDIADWGESVTTSEQLATTSRSRADDLYRSRKFTDAANILSSAAQHVDEDEAANLRETANYYGQLAKALSSGEAPTRDPLAAFEQLRSALAFDKQVGGAFILEIEGKLGSVAPKAAFMYLAQRNYAKARTAVIESERLGAGDSVRTVKAKLESAIASTP